MDPLSSMLNNKRDSGNRTFARIGMRKRHRLVPMRKLHTSDEFFLGKALKNIKNIIRFLLKKMYEKKGFSTSGN
jgi:hypothetical protein